MAKANRPFRAPDHYKGLSGKAVIALAGAAIAAGVSGVPIQTPDTRIRPYGESGYLNYRGNGTKRRWHPERSYGSQTTYRCLRSPC